MALRTFESERDALIAYVHTIVQMVTFKCASDFRFARLFFSHFNFMFLYLHAHAHTSFSLSLLMGSVRSYVLFMFVWGWSHEEFLDLFSIRSRLRKSIFHFLCSLLFKSAFQIWHISEFGKLHGSKLEASERAREEEWKKCRIDNKCYLTFWQNKSTELFDIFCCFLSSLGNNYSYAGRTRVAGWV